MLHKLLLMHMVMKKRVLESKMLYLMYNPINFLTIQTRVSRPFS